MKIRVIESLFTTVFLSVNLFPCLAFTPSLATQEKVFISDLKTTPLQHSHKNIMATLSKDSSEEDIEGMITYFKRNAIKIDFSEVNYNENDEIIGIKIVMEKEGQQANYAMASNKPIQTLELGYKNGILFVREKNSVPSNHPLSGIFQQLQNGNFKGESFMNEDAFSLDFDNSVFREMLSQGFGDLLHGFNSLLQSPEQREQSKKERISPNSQAIPKKSVPKKDPVIPQRKPTAESRQGVLPKYNFSDKYGIEKLVIIDGEVQTFENLDRLAKADRLLDVDFLKSSTAISIYGQEAKYGAIIATTK